jgi:hypothetical protein
MNIYEAEARDTDWLTCGNKQAGEFLRLWRAYVHGIDDIIDGDLKESEGILRVFMLAAFVYAHPFYLQNMAALQQIVINCTNAYADTVAWERSEEPWRRQFADHYRHFGAEMVLAIAHICGGFDHMRKVSPLLRETCWKEHHDDNGNAV